MSLNQENPSQTSDRSETGTRLPLDRIRHVNPDALDDLRRVHDLLDDESTLRMAPWDEGHWANRQKKK